ncbi:PREDICTED: uncharacterized protein At4g19900 [Nelumbo nucifera]|uniref:Uncharacterized protein At4g19900 n=2 Tax=Nelumbo nucifera TaxID=4432 RepID=A0A1U8B5F7_NELNU|nr:PREDICTED: uncharacterized protein At4g19900 [Nelumbo nucifera]DAD43898.1 TPA_asm: hypothetical protein HUJ06_002128 [Nelumbo nucifera]
MFRTFRNRRRPRYGAQLCTIIAALLLLLSVSVLYSRLSFDRRSQVRPFSSSRLGLGFPSVPNLDFSQDSSNDLDELVANPLLEDVDGDGAGNGNDDRIDELDVVEEESDDQSKLSNEEEILRGVDEEESESEGVDWNRNKRFGYYWDHVLGVTRRAFDRRSIDEQWDDYSDSSFGLDSEDRSKIVFASDDQPLDEDIRGKLDQINGIEDALLLKAGNRVSPLREGWAAWFEAKGDFLRRDRMFKSNLELLNPLNNPLLQDPDGISTVLTRGDKLMQKVMWNELKKIPFGVRKPLGILEKPRDSEVVGDGHDSSARKRNNVNVGIKGLEGNAEGTKNEVKRTERRTLDDTSTANVDSNNIVNVSESFNSAKKAAIVNETSHTDMVKKQGFSSYKSTGRGPLQHGYTKGIENSSRGELVQQTLLKNPDSVSQVQSEVSGPKYADGKRWGYFPGLDPYLSFSDFMDEFFGKGKCSMKVFMVWNSPPWMYSVRHQRGLESLLYHHPDACVVVFSETIELDFFKGFVKDGFKVAVAMPNLDELLKNTPTHVFASVWFEWRKTKFYSIHYSELIRLAALYKYGGLYIDSDVVVLKRLSSFNNSIGMEDQVDGSSLNGALMAFRKHSPFIMECLKEFYSTYDDAQLRWNGADLLTRVGKKFLSKWDNSGKPIELKKQQSFVFFPISHQNIIRYFTAPSDEAERAQQDVFFRKILNESFTFHFWNSLTSALVPEPESVAAKLLNCYCLRCFDVL